MHFFTKQLLSWHLKYNNRALPWKHEKDPYKIWLSEIILQQTRAEQGLPYYLKFINTYPTIKHLAKAKDDEVFKLWEGLGYYSRCKNLLFTARTITQNYKGIFPTKYEDIIQLKGVGTYTAAAICSFAYNQAYAVVDGNVYRILARFFGIQTPTDSPKGKREFLNLANNLLHSKKPALYNQAIMDFGATVCTPKNPKCENCVLQKQCVEFYTKKILYLPVKEKKLLKQNRYLYFFIIQHQQKIAIAKRTKKDIWQNLHQFYLIEKDEPQEITTQIIKQWLHPIFANQKFEVKEISSAQKQSLTHQNISGQFVHINAQISTQKINLPKEYFWIDVKEISSHAFPKFINQYLQGLIF